MHYFLTDARRIIPLLIGCISEQQLTPSLTLSKDQCSANLGADRLVFRQDYKVYPFSEFFHSTPNGGLESM